MSACGGVLLWIILILCIILGITYMVSHRPVVVEIHNCNWEPFSVPAKEVNAAVIFAVYNMDENDYEFVKRWSATIPFYIVNNGVPTKWVNDAQVLPNVKVLVRENVGHDVAAWRNGMREWDAELSTKDVVAFVNNSCVYYIDLHKIMNNAMDYDMYGLSQDTKPTKMFRHIQSVFIVINKRLYNSEFFKEHWNNLRDDKGHRYAVMNHEVGFTQKAIKRGYKLGVYDLLNGNTLYKEDPKTDEYKREFIKKYDLSYNTRDAPNVLREYITNNKSKGYDVVDLTNPE